MLLAGCTGDFTDQATTPASSRETPQNLPFGQTSSTTAVNMWLPAGTPLPIRLRSSISSRTATPGDRFQAILDESIEVDGKTVALRGTRVTGRVVAARSSGRLQNPGYLRITLESMNLNGKQLQLQTSSIFVQGRSHKQRNLVMIGGGAGTGALFGALAGGGKGALIGTAAGAAAGTGAAYATGRKEVGLAVERRLTFRLLQPAPLK